MSVEADRKLPGVNSAWNSTYMEALGAGLTVADLSDASAKTEAAFLVNECLKLTNRK